MKVKVDTPQLNSALNLIMNIVDKKTTMSILMNVVLTAKDKQLTLIGSDIENSIQINIPAEVTSPGRTAVSVKMLSDMVRELSEVKTEMSLSEGQRLDIHCGSAKIKIIGFSPDEYPNLPGLSLSANTSIDQKQLLEMIDKTVYAVSLDETRRNLGGVCFVFSKSGKSTQLKMVATDGHRLALITRPIEKTNFEPGTVLIPRKGVTEMKRLLDQNTGKETKVGISEGFLIMETGDSKISIRLMDAEFPDYSQVIPESCATTVKVETQELSQALRIVALMVSDKARGVKFDFSKGLLRLSSSSPELGEAKEEIEVDYKGDPLSVRFNAKYALDFISSLGETGHVEIGLNGEAGAGVFKAENDDSYIGIIMPMRID